MSIQTLKQAFAASALLFAASVAMASVTTGLDSLIADDFAPLEGKNVGLITNHTGVDARGRSEAEIFAASDKFRLVALFSPEHGLFGKAEGGDHVSDSYYGPKHIPVYSLYGDTRKPTLEMLKNVDVLVFDIQDVGARFYTYLSTMGLAMEEADRLGIPFFVLDRPNPLGGDIMEGPVLDPSLQSFISFFPVPVRHGMTAGEMALLEAATKKLNMTPEVIKVKGWKRAELYDATGLGWINPSPNIRDLDAAIFYPGIGCFEATNISVGRGTDSPFHWFGAPWLDAKKLLAKLNAANIPGVKFSYEERKPSSDMYAGKLCRGIKMEITDRDAFRSLYVYVNVICALRDMKVRDFEFIADGAKHMTGSADIEKLYKSGASAKTILDAFGVSRRAFEKSRQPYLLY
jgi:uncharacterized protein YbbC (DUF1343 family)